MHPSLLAETQEVVLYITKTLEAENKFYYKDQVYPHLTQISNILNHYLSLI